MALSFDLEEISKSIVFLVAFEEDPGFVILFALGNDLGTPIP
jgi:hypothetical protein